MSSRSATALAVSGCTSTMSESVNQRIRSMSCTARSMTTPTLDMRGGNGPTRVIEIERISSPRIASLMVSTAGLKRSTWPTMRVTPARRRDDAAPLLRIGRDRLLHQDVDAALDAGERDVVVQMGGRRDGHGVDAQRQQRVEIVDGVGPQRTGDEAGLLPVRIGDSDKLNPRQAGENARVVAAHDPDADDTDPQRGFRTALYALHHDETEPPRCSRPAGKTPSTPGPGWRPAPEHTRERAWNQILIA